MHIKTLNLENFRNHISKTMIFEDNTINLFLGDNGIGKTNLLESIYLLSLSKSFKTSHLEELVNFEKDYCRVQSTIGDERELKLEFFYQKAPTILKALKKDNVKTPIYKYIGNLLVSFFCPDDLNLLYLEPSRRRRYLNVVLSQIYPEYFESLVKFEKILINRNKLLAMIFEKRAKTADLEVWDNELVIYGQRIIDRRKEFFDEIKNDLKIFYKDISYANDELSFEYKYNSNLAEDLKKNQHIDLKSLKTSIGPHRDDFIFYLNGHEISSFASRGECRSAVLALKFAERNFFHTKVKKFPLMLMDDVFSELDKKRQEHILKMLQKSQVFISSAVDDLENNSDDRIRKFHLT